MPDRDARDSVFQRPTARRGGSRGPATPRCGRDRTRSTSRGQATFERVAGAREDPTVSSASRAGRRLGDVERLRGRRVSYWSEDRDRTAGRPARREIPAPRFVHTKRISTPWKWDYAEPSGHVWRRRVPATDAYNDGGWVCPIRMAWVPRALGLGGVPYGRWGQSLRPDGMDRVASGSRWFVGCQRSYVGWCPWGYGDRPCT